MRILCPVVLRQCKLAEIGPSLVTVLASMPGKVIVYGGRGGLGVVVVSTFRQAGYEVLYCMYCSVLYCTVQVRGPVGGHRGQHRGRA